MRFTRRKIPINQAASMRRLSVSEILPYDLAFSPLYILLEKNKKFVALKEPLDFFNHEQLEKIKSVQTIYTTEFSNLLEPYRAIARSVKALLNVQHALEENIPGDLFSDIEMPPIPYELSDLILKEIAPLWSKDGSAPVFAILIFAYVLCDLFPEALLQATREHNIIQYELAFFRGACAVFLALHLGMCDLEFLSYLFVHSFTFTVETLAIDAPLTHVDELLTFIRNIIPTAEQEAITRSQIQESPSRIAQMVIGRIDRALNGVDDTSLPLVSIKGPEGFANE